MINYFDIFFGVTFWALSLLLLALSFYSPNIYVGILVFLLGLVNLLNAVGYMDDLFKLDDKRWKV